MKMPIEKKQRIIFSGFILIIVSILLFTSNWQSFWGKNESTTLISTEKRISTEDFSIFDTVLSVIKNYYVDSDTIKYRDLLKSTLGNLQVEGKLDLRIIADKIQITNGSQFYEIPVPNENDPINIETLGKISQFLVNIGNTKDLQSAKIDVLSSLVSSLDPYSRLLAEDEYRELQEATQGEFGGLGILVGVRNSLLTVIKAFPYSPASRAGIISQDHIVSVNGKSAFGFSLDEIIKHIRGTPGTPVTLSLLRDGALSPYDVSLNREMIQVDPISTQNIKTPTGSRILLVKIDNFSNKSANRFREELEKAAATKERSLDGLIIDLRSNPGGLLDQAVTIANTLIPEGPIVTVKGKQTETEYANQENIPLSCPIIVLVNDESASASEILAGALKDYDRAVIIGQPSFGKGTVQTVFELPEGKALKLTIARYLTPRGISIQGTGVIPHIWLHPVYRQEKNENMFGHYRYHKGDVFLGYHPPKKASEQRSAIQNHYYLKEPRKETDPLQSEELELSLAIFDSYKSKNVKINNGEYPTSSHIIRAIGSKVEQKMKNWNSKVQKFLKEKIALDWKTKGESIDTTVKIREFKIDQANKFSPGSLVSISYQISNDSALDLEKISAFIRAGREMDTAEKLIGHIEKGQNLQTSMEFNIPTSWSTGKVELELALAKDGFEIPETKIPFSLFITPRDEAQITTQTTLVTPTGGGLVDTLLAGQKAKLIIKLINKSNVKVHVDSINLVNLAGKQIIINDDLQKVQAGDIEPHGEKTLTVGITGSKVLYSDRLGLGLSVESHDLKSPFYNTIYVQATPTKKKLLK